MLEIKFTGIFKDAEELFQDFIRRNENLELVEIEVEKEERKNILGIKEYKNIIIATFVEKEEE
jgi:hypothetical protein